MAAFPLRGLGWGGPGGCRWPPFGLGGPPEPPMGTFRASFRRNFGEIWGPAGQKCMRTLGSIPKKRSAPAARGLPRTVWVCTAAVGSARVVVCGIGTASVGCRKGFFGGLATKVSATGFRLALGPDIMSKIRFGLKRPPACGWRASGPPRGFQSLVRSGPTSTGGHGVGGRNPPSADLPFSGATEF